MCMEKKFSCHVGEVLLNKQLSLLKNFSEPLTYMCIEHLQKDDKLGSIFLIDLAFPWQRALWL